MVVGARESVGATARVAVAAVVNVGAADLARAEARAPDAGVGANWGAEARVAAVEAGGVEAGEGAEMESDWAEAKKEAGVSADLVAATRGRQAVADRRSCRRPPMPPKSSWATRGPCTRERDRWAGAGLGLTNRRSCRRPPLPPESS